MADRRLVYEFPAGHSRAGTISIHEPAYDDRHRKQRFPDDTDDALYKRMEDRMPAGARFYWEDVTSRDRTFRDAWVLNAAGDGLEVDMPKARLLHKERIRLASISQGLQVPSFDLEVYSTPAELDAAWPPELPARE